MDYVKAAALGAAGAIFVRLFFAAVRSEWPASYSLVSSPAQREQRRSLFRYLLIRGLPVFLAALFALTVTVKVDASLWTCFWVFLLMELFVSSLRGLVTLAFVRGVPAVRRIELVLYYLATSALVVLATLAAMALREQLAVIVPDVQELPTTLWTGVFAAVTAISLRRFTETAASNSYNLEFARLDPGPVLLGYARQASVTADCDADLIEAIILAECVQRPSWFRQLERLKGRAWKSGTYGVAQVHSDKPISDTESIDKLCGHFQGYYPLRTNDNQQAVRRGALEAKLILHNPDNDFVSSVIEMYLSMSGWTLSGSSRIARDGRSEVIISEGTEREGQSRAISGTAWTSSDRVWLHYSGVVSGDTQAALIGPSAGRRSYTAQIPLEAEVVRVAPFDKPSDAAVTAEMELRYY